MSRSERFREARLKAGFGQNKVCELTGLSHWTIQRTEDKNQEYTDFKFHTVYILAQLYGVSVMWLMEGEE